MIKKKIKKRGTAYAQEVLVEKCSLSKTLNKKETEIEELRNKRYSICKNGCEKYSKPIDEIVEAASKHREKLIALKEISESQKEKIFCLRGHRNELLDEIDRINSDNESDLKERILKTSSLQEENKILHTQNNDKKEELETKTARIKHLEMCSEGNNDGNL